MDPIANRRLHLHGMLAAVMAAILVFGTSFPNASALGLVDKITDPVKKLISPIINPIVDPVVEPDPDPAPVPEPVPCNCVIFRLDDIQDFWLSSVQNEIMNEFVERNEKVSLGVVMNFVGNDAALVNNVRDGATTEHFELVLHGWNHVDYQTLTLQDQHDTLKQANEKMQTLWGRESRVFIPPYNSYNEDTLQATNQLGLKIISAEFDSEIASVFPHPEEPANPDNKIYMAFNGSNIADHQGIYHLPQVVGYYNYEFSPEQPPAKNSLAFIEQQIDSVMGTYGYAVVTLHPPEFTVKDANGNWTPEISPQEISDLDTLITDIKNKGYRIATFSDVSDVPLAPIVDNAPPIVTPPSDIALVSSSEQTEVDLGQPVVTDNVDRSPAISNNAPSGGFPQGTTEVVWTAVDDAGNSGSAIQYVTIASTADATRPAVSITSPSNGDVIAGPQSGINIEVLGTAADGQSGVKRVDVRTDKLGYMAAMPAAPDDWSSWSFVLNVQQSGNVSIVARATDYFGNQQWHTIVVTVSLEGPDTTPPQLVAPADMQIEYAGENTAMMFGMPTVSDNSDPAPTITRDGPGASEMPRLPLGVTVVKWTATDAAGNTSTAVQLITIVDEVTDLLDRLTSPLTGG